MQKSFTRDRKKETLDSYLTRLIASVDNVPVDQVSVEHIRQQREKLIYPDARHNIGSDYGGYDSAGLIFYTRREFDQIEETIDKNIKEFLARE